jgi:hypothetical protein
MDIGHSSVYLYVNLYFRLAKIRARICYIFCSASCYNFKRDPNKYSTVNYIYPVPFHNFLSTKTSKLDFNSMFIIFYVQTFRTRLLEVILIKMNRCHLICLYCYQNILSFKLCSTLKMRELLKPDIFFNEK